MQMQLSNQDNISELIFNQAWFDDWLTQSRHGVGSLVLGHTGIQGCMVLVSMLINNDVIFVNAFTAALREIRHSGACAFMVKFHTNLSLLLHYSILFSQSHCLNYQHRVNNY